MRLVAQPHRRGELQPLGCLTFCAFLRRGGERVHSQQLACAKSRGNVRSAPRTSSVLLTVWFAPRLGCAPRRALHEV